MKQGQAENKGPNDQKIEPRSKAINPAAVAQLGIIQGNHAMDAGGKILDNVPNMSLGNGYNPASPNDTPAGWDQEGPGSGRIIRNSGTQGKY